ncbi:MAG TPA: phosphodiester glycosidase family protein, partial [Bacteroidales bacterium]|nr:phosphodiester glycosidase family protein [Bacteroidales bacterium]
MDLLGLQVGHSLEIHLPGMDNLLHAVEAGPILLKDRQVAIDMTLEGWTTQKSINTQAARMDYTDMRGPKIAAGINKQNDILVLAVNGRIRESVGATHHDMANILLNYDVTDALGFDPGGSSTLILDGEQLNISPYNADYLRNPYAAPPQPRFVSSAIFVTKKG